MSSVKREAQVNGTGAVVTCYNLQRALTPLGVTEAECQAIFSKLDRNADGVITEQDFQETWQEAAQNYTNRACDKVIPRQRPLPPSFPTAQSDEIQSRLRTSRTTLTLTLNHARVLARVLALALTLLLGPTFRAPPLGAASF